MAQRKSMRDNDHVKSHEIVVEIGEKSHNLRINSEPSTELGVWVQTGHVECPGNRSARITTRPTRMA